MEQIGALVQREILESALLLKGDSVPGLIAAGLLTVCALFLLALWRVMRARVVVLRRLKMKICEFDGEKFAGSGFDEISAWVKTGLKGKRSIVEPLREAWDEFGETLVVDDRHDLPVRRNTVRPSMFFNIEDLGYGPGFYRILPGIFVSVGLALTFLGLIGALHEMSGKAIDDTAMQGLIRIASAKFMMSLSGLASSIALALALRWLIGGVDKALHTLVRELERRLDFVSLESLALAGC